MRGCGRRLSAPGARISSASTAASAASPLDLKTRGRRADAARPARAGRCLHRELQTGQPRQARIRLRGDARAQPAPDLLLDQRLRPDRPAASPDRLRPDRAGGIGIHGHHRHAGRPAGADRHRDDRLSGRALRVRRDPAGAARARSDRPAASTSTSRSTIRSCRRCRCRPACCSRPGASRSAWATIIRRSRRTKCCVRRRHADDRRRPTAGCGSSCAPPIGRRDLADDPALQDEHRSREEPPGAQGGARTRVFARYTVDALVERLTEFGVPCGRVRTVSEALADPQVEPRQMLIPFDDPELGSFRVLGNPIKLSDTPADLSRRPPKLGEHTAEILRRAARRRPRSKRRVSAAGVAAFAGRRTRQPAHPAAARRPGQLHAQFLQSDRRTPPSARRRQHGVAPRALREVPT